MTANEAYYLLIPLIYTLNVYLLQRKVRFLYYTLIISAIILACFHRTVWMASLSAVLLNWFLIRSYTQIKALDVVTRLMPVLLSSIIFIVSLLYAKPELVNSLVESFSDIQNADSQGTGGWRSQQRDIYMALVPEHPFLGWTYEGYDKGEVMANEFTEEWTGAKGTFIHSGYVYALYNFGLVGLFMQCGIILFTIIHFYRIFNRQDPGQWALLIFMCSAYVFAWSYQLPDFFWAFLGVAVYFIYQADLMARWSTHLMNEKNIPDHELETEIV